MYRTHHTVYSDTYTGFDEEERRQLFYCPVQSSSHTQGEVSDEDFVRPNEGHNYVPVKRKEHLDMVEGITNMVFCNKIELEKSIFQDVHGAFTVYACV